MRHVASLAIDATSCALWQPPEAGTRLPCPTEASGATGIWQHGACAQTPAQALASGWTLGCHPGHLEKLQGGLKTSPGGCDPAMGVRAPAPRHAAGPLTLLCEADAEMMAAPPGPPGTQQPPHGCSQPWGGHSLAVTQGPKPAMPIPASPAWFPRGPATTVPRGFRILFAQLCRPPGPCVGGWKMVSRGSECQRPCSHRGASSHRAPKLPPPRGDVGAWLPPWFPQGQIYPLLWPRVWGNAGYPPAAGACGEPDQSVQVPPNTPKPRCVCQSPLFPRFWWGMWGLGQQRGSPSAPLPGGRQPG